MLCGLETGRGSNDSLAWQLTFFGCERACVRLWIALSETHETGESFRVAEFRPASRSRNRGDPRERITVKGQRKASPKRNNAMPCSHTHTLLAHCVGARQGLIDAQLPCCRIGAHACTCMIKPSRATWHSSDTHRQSKDSLPFLLEFGDCATQLFTEAAARNKPCAFLHSGSR